MKLFATHDISASVHKAYEDFTHIALNRSYTTIRPIFFKAAALNDLPVHQYASWVPASAHQLSMWKDTGGVLVEQDTHPEAFPVDVTVMVECPYDMARLEACNKRNAEYGVIPRPGSWTTHEECVDLRFPDSDTLKALWLFCGGKMLTNHELAQDAGFSVTEVQYMKNSLKPVEHWHIQKRLAPERTEFIPAYDWLEARPYTKADITKSGFRSQIEEMGRFGYIGLKRLQHYPSETPDWRRLDKRRREALKDLAAVRSLVESLPDHLQTSEPSDEST